MDLTRTQDIVGLAIGVATLMGLVVGWLRWVRPRIRRLRAKTVMALDSLVGREAVIDTITGEEIAPALPGIGARMSHQEQQVELLSVAVTKLVDQQDHQRKLEERVDSHDHRIKALEEQAIERVATKAESVAAWRAVEAVAKQTDPVPPEIED